MNSNLMLYMLAGVGVLFVIIVIAYIILSKKLKSSDTMQIRQLRQGTKENKFSMEILYQKLYVIYIILAFLKRYVFKKEEDLKL